jgi:uncharacterized paraquat-inducible protein A
MKEQTPALDVITNEVLCGECNRPITTITEFAKRQMKSMGQVMTNIKTRTPYAVKCAKCKTENTPLIEGDELTCARCHTVLNVNKHFAMMFKSAMKNKFQP